MLNQLDLFGALPIPALALPEIAGTTAKPKAAPCRQSVADRRAQATAYAIDLPDDEGALCEIARAALDDYHAAVLANDDSAIVRAHKAYAACVYRLNGNTSFGCYGGDGAAGYRVRDYCAAPDGTAPMWGQYGRFLVDIGRVRAVVTHNGFAGAFGSEYRTHFEFRALDLNRPFISQTGYLSHFTTIPEGGTVADHAAEILATSARDHRPSMIAVQFRAGCHEEQTADPAFQPGGWLHSLRTVAVPTQPRAERAAPVLARTQQIPLDLAACAA
ncbi:MAG: hypothetical protein M0006_15685 [Magnetospirillum sp.]|nr:hypothetical protein [Magnetospirillum sp.]